MKHLQSLCLLVFVSATLRAGEIKPSVEIEFNLFYNRNYPQPFSFQFREAKLFLDTRISDQSNALIEYVMVDNLQRAELERAYFIQHDLPANGQLTLGQFRSPFGYYDAFTVSHAMIKQTALAPDTLMPESRLRSVEVGAMWESIGDRVSFALALVNGNGINKLSDDNNFKDLIAHISYSLDEFQIGANAYYGRKNALDRTGAVTDFSAVEVAAYGMEAMVSLEKAVLAGEAVTRHYGGRTANGAYLMMNYDLGAFVPTLRTTSRLEYFDPDQGGAGDERIQWSQGFLYTISRGYMAKLEWVLNLENHPQAANEIMFELEYEL